MQPGYPREVTFVLGGVRSGKSRFAQRIALAHDNVVFIATATPGDREMEERIKRHQQNRPREWQTIESPLDLDATILSLRDAHQLAVVDCLTIYLANVMTHVQSHISEIEECVRRLCTSLTAAQPSIVVVSNEVGSGVHAMTPSGRLYCDLLGEMNQRVALLATNVILMVAGIPVPIKGRIPLEVQSDSGVSAALV
jgi:adenosylcobinamide kinase / adenosylcobinamide-phosphate guanylyltransferase